MGDYPTRTTCRCGKGKVSAWDGKCGHCRNSREVLVHQRLLDGWTKEEAELGRRKSGWWLP